MLDLENSSENEQQNIEIAGSSIFSDFNLSNYSVINFIY